MNSNLKKIIMTALFAALACVATMSIRIPTPGTGGYIHPGDAIVILAGIILGPVYGMLAGGIGSALSDLIGGYFVYVPITLVIKGLVALVSGLIYQKMCRSGKKRYFFQSPREITKKSRAASGIHSERCRTFCGIPSRSSAHCHSRPGPKSP